MKLLKRLYFLGVFSLFAASCAQEVAEEIPAQPQQLAEVSFAMPVEASRTMVDAEGNTRWVVGDKLALWAANSDGEFVAEGAQFMLRHFSGTYTKAYFAGNIAQQEPGTYTYYMCSPMPASTSGTSVTYNVPAQQSGKYESIYDIMVARTLEADAITSPYQVELNTSFIHQMHALKITIPEGRNSFVEKSSSKFYSLEITFPTPVVGDITFDVTQPDAKPTYTNTTNVITVSSEEGFDAGSEIWVFVLPGTVDGDVSYHVRGERRRSNIATYGLSREFKRGSITPIKMHIPEIYPLYTALHFTIGHEYLGEPFNFFDVYNAKGDLMGTFQRNEENKYTIDYEGEFDADQYDNTSWRVVFDSKHAVVETSINIGNLTDYTEHTCRMDVPYLFAEDFSAVPTWTDKHDNPGTGESDLYVGITELSGQNLPGWWGTRIGMQNGAVRICGRYQHVLLAGAFYKGRLYTPLISGLKDGASPQLRISYNYSNSISESKPNVFGSKPNASPLLYFGLDQQKDGEVVNYDDTGAASIITSGGYMDRAPSSLAIKYINGEALPTSGGSYTSITNTKSMLVNNVTNQCRFAWIVSSANNKSNCNGNYWLYIDNIKVSIEL